jgi:hypothetical protein
VGPHPELRRVRLGMEAREDLHPHLHIAALEGPDCRLVLIGKAAEIPVLDPDDVRLAQREVHLELHQATQGRQGIGTAGCHPAPAVQQFLADGDQQVREDRLLAGKVAVNGRAADAGGCPKVPRETRLKPCSANSDAAADNSAWRRFSFARLRCVGLPGWDGLAGWGALPGLVVLPAAAASVLGTIPPRTPEV